MFRKKNLFRKKDDFVNRKMDFPELAPTTNKETTALDYKNLKHIEKEEDEKKVPDGWIKLYYKNGKIVKEYGRVWRAKPKYIETPDEAFTRVIGNMRERWEKYNEEQELEVDYDFYWEQNEYEEEIPESPESQENVMNENLVENNKYYD
jgi:hypothetical protein